ncbi:hypothetical protein BJV82DRAFT_630659, partial [Fennellomyces sp. T-0311]
IVDGVEERERRMVKLCFSHPLVFFAATLTQLSGVHSQIQPCNDYFGCQPMGSLHSACHCLHAATLCLLPELTTAFPYITHHLCSFHISATP